MLFKDPEDLATVYPTLDSADFTMLTQVIDPVEREYLRDIILGPTLYDALLTAYAASIAPSPTALSASMQKLSDACRKAIAFLASDRIISTVNTLVTSGGVKQMKQEDRASMWSVRARLAADLSTAYSNLNQLINLLLENPSDYSTWLTSPLAVEIKESLVPRAQDASRYMKLHGPWLLHQLRPAMREVQTGPVLTILGQTAYDTLLTNVHNSAHTLTTTEKAILNHVRPAILHGALADQLIPLGLKVDNTGVWSWKSVSSGGAISGGEEPSAADRMDGLMRHHLNKSRMHLEQLNTLVNPNAETGDRKVRGDGSNLFLG